jgi:hypothetical protein
MRRVLTLLLLLLLPVGSDALDLRVGFGSSPASGVNEPITLSGAVSGTGTTAITTTLATVPVATGGTGLTTGTSGGILAFTAAGTLASSGVLTANLPVIGGGAGVAPSVGTRSGTTTAFVTLSGTATSGMCAQWDASGNLTATGSACGAATGLGDPGANGVVVRTSLGTTTPRTLTGTANQITIVNGDGVAGNPTISIPTSPIFTTPTIASFTNATHTHADAAGGGQLSLTTAVTGILPGANGGSANGFFAVTGPATSLKTFTFPNASATVLTSNAAVTIAQGGTGTASTLTGLMRGSASAMTAAELSGDCTTSGSNVVSCTQLAGAFFAVTGPATSTKTFTFPNASATVLTSNAAVTILQGGTGTSSTLAGLVRGSASAMTAAELSGDVITAGSNATTIAAGVVTLAKMANLATATLIGRTTAGTGVPEALTVLPAALFPALTGDVTTSAGALATTIPAGTVTLAKMANMATASFLGRTTAATGVPEVLSVSTASTMLGVVGAKLGYIQLPMSGAKLPTSNPGVIDNAENHTRILFDASTQECVVWQFLMPPDYGTGLQARALYAMTSATSGGVAIDTSIMATTPGDAVDVNTESYASLNTCTDAAVPATAGFLDTIVCTQTNTDSLAAGDLTKFKFCRAPANATDTAAGDLELYGLMLEYVKN